MQQFEANRTNVQRRQTMTIPNRCLEWNTDGIHYETDPKHVEIVIRELKIENAKPVVGPNIKTTQLTDDENPHFARESSKVRQLIAMCNFIAQYRPDAHYAVKEITRGMASPKKTVWEERVRLGKYLVGKPRHVTV